MAEMVSVFILDENGLTIGIKCQKCLAVLGPLEENYVKVIEDPKEHLKRSDGEYIQFPIFCDKCLKKLGY